MNKPQAMVLSRFSTRPYGSYFAITEIKVWSLPLVVPFERFSSPRRTFASAYRHLDLQINPLSEQENTQMLSMLRAIVEKVGADLNQDEQVRAMSEETKP
jgi:hypothetical protein